jgi:hypothetical protein
MRYSIYYQQVSQGQSHARIDACPTEIIFNSDHGLALIPCVGDVINLPSTAVKGGYAASLDQGFSIIYEAQKICTATSIFLLKRRALGGRIIDPSRCGDLVYRIQAGAGALGASWCSH